VLIDVLTVQLPQQTI